MRPRWTRALVHAVTLAGVRVAHTARTGVRQYVGKEAGRPDLTMVNVYRDKAEVSAKIRTSALQIPRPAEAHGPIRPANRYALANAVP